jgi:aminoglycoside phosphotransferase (APT) family kinase protein
MSIIDQARLEHYLAEKLDAEGLSITSVWKNLEGWSMETFSIGLSYIKHGKRVEREIIIRKEPVSGLLEPYDASTEYRVLTALNHTDIAVPETYWYEPDPEVLGLPFYVMEKVEGEVHFWSLVLDPNWRLIPDDDERMSLARDFIHNIAGIHKADWRSLGLEFLGDPGPGTGSALAQVEYWEEMIVHAGFRNKPVVAYTVNWLKDNLVSNDRVTLVHGDYRTGNYIAREGHIAAVLDWEMVHLGDPIEDISYIIGTPWRSPRPNLWVSHLLPQEEFFARYEEASGIKIDREKLRFYHVLNNFKAIGIAGTAANAFKTKPNPDLRVGVFGMTLYIQYFNMIRTFNKYLSAGKGA